MPKVHYSDFLLPSELPNNITCFDVQFNVSSLETYTGTVASNQPFDYLLLLNEALPRALVYNYAILCFGGFGVGLIQSSINGTVFLFDSHSRDRDGFPLENGTSVLLSFKDVTSV